MDFEYLESLPEELLFQTLLELPAEDVVSFCQTSRRHAAICRDQSFWSRKARRDFGKPLPTPYQQYLQMRPPSITGTSWTARFPTVYHYIELFSSNPKAALEQMNHWETHPSRELREKMIDDLISEEESGGAEVEVDIPHIKQWLSEVVKPPNIVSGGVIARLVYIYEKLIQLGMAPNIPDANLFFNRLTNITYEDNPQAFDDVWILYDEIGEVAIDLEEEANLRQLFEDFVAQHPELTR